MISESVIIFGATGNVVMVLDDEILPKGTSVLFKVGASKLDLIDDNGHVFYTEKDLNNYICQRLKTKGEIGLLEVKDKAKPPLHLTNVAYQAAH